MCDRKYGGWRTRARRRNQSKVTGHIRRKAQEMWSLILEKVGPYVRVSGSLACLLDSYSYGHVAYLSLRE